MKYRTEKKQKHRDQKKEGIRNVETVYSWSCSYSSVFSAKPYTRREYLFGVFELISWPKKISWRDVAKWRGYNEHKAD